MWSFLYVSSIEHWFRRSLLLLQDLLRTVYGLHMCDGLAIDTGNGMQWTRIFFFWICFPGFQSVEHEKRPHPYLEGV